MRYIMFLLLGQVFVFGQLAAQNDTLVRWVQEIEALEQAYEREDGSGKEASVRKLTASYVGFAEDFPNEVQSAEYLMRAARLYLYHLQLPESALQALSQLIQQQSEHALVPTALFMMGFIYQNHLSQPAEARLMYEKFLTSFPQHSLAESVKFELAEMK